MSIYLITLLNVLNSVALRGSRVLMSLFAIQLGSGAFEIGILISVSLMFQLQIGVPLLFGLVGSAFGLMTVFWSNAVFLVAGAYLNQKPDKKASG